MQVPVLYCALSIGNLCSEALFSPQFGETDKHLASILISQQELCLRKDRTQPLTVGSVLTVPVVKASIACQSPPVSPLQIPDPSGPCFFISSLML